MNAKRWLIITTCTVYTPGFRILQNQNNVALDLFVFVIVSLSTIMLQYRFTRQVMISFIVLLLAGRTRIGKKCPSQYACTSATARVRYEVDWVLDRTTMRGREMYIIFSWRNIYPTAKARHLLEGTHSIVDDLRISFALRDPQFFSLNGSMYYFWRVKNMRGDDYVLSLWSNTFFDIEARDAPSYLHFSQWKSTLAYCTRTVILKVAVR